MRLFGFYYTSVGSIILFFIIATIISYPFSLLADVLPKALLMLEKSKRSIGGTLVDLPIFLDN